MAMKLSPAMLMLTVKLIPALRSSSGLGMRACTSKVPLAGSTVIVDGHDGAGDLVLRTGDGHCGDRATRLEGTHQPLRHPETDQECRTVLDRGDDGLGGDGIAGIDLDDAYGAVDRRGDRAVLEVELGASDAKLGGAQRQFVRLDRGCRHGIGGSELLGAVERRLRVDKGEPRLVISDLLAVRRRAAQ